MDVSYGKKVKDTSSRGKTSKEEWKEREASANQAVPTRIKIFEGGSVERLTIRTQHRTCACAPCLVKNILYSACQVQIQRRLRVRQRPRPGEIHL